MFMFDFLAEGKRSIIINHPELGGILKSAHSVDLFAQNLSAFRSDLCSKTLDSRVRFSEEEIDRIEKYSRNFFSDELKDLSHRIFTEAGFEVYHQVAGREDLNDWVKLESCYVRALHKLHGYTSHQKMIELNNQVTFMADPGMPLRLLYPVPIQENFQIKVAPPTKAKVENIRHTSPNELFWIFRSQDPFDDPPYQTNSPYNRYYGWNTREFPNLLRCGFLCGRLEYDGTNIKTAKALPLKYIVQTEHMHRAYLLQFFIQKFVPSGIGRSSGFPVVYVVASEKRVEDTVWYLLENPDLYCDFVRGFIPKSVFPNVNKGILDAPSLSTKGIVFENYTAGQSVKVGL